MKIDYRKAITGAFVFGVLVVIINTIYINLVVINSMFTKEIPIGTILLVIFGIIILDHLRRLFRFYQVCAENRNVVGIVSNACIYLIILSISLSIQYNFRDYTITSTIPQDIQKTQSNYKYSIKIIDDNERIEYNRYYPENCYMSIKSLKQNLITKTGSCDKTDIDILKTNGIIINTI